MTPSRLVLFAVLFLSPAAALAQVTDSDILNELHSSNVAAVTAAGLVRSRTGNKEVRRLARDIARDHGRADGLVVAMAGRKQIRLAAPAPKHGPLAKLSGTAFDRAYVSAMIREHEVALAFLDKAAADSKDPEVLQLVDRRMPTVMHLKQMGQKIEGGGSATSEL
jgi:putative membrane protein